MKDLIKFDFDVETCCEEGNENLFYNVDDLFYKFVWLMERNPFDDMRQYYVIRYELASIFKQHLLAHEVINSSYTLSTGEIIEFSGPDWIFWRY
jgi:hypothetical protein